MPRRWCAPTICAVVAGVLVFSFGALWWYFRPILTVNRIAQDVAGPSQDGVYGLTADAARARGIAALGGPKQAAHSLAKYLAAPRLVAPRKMAALYLLGSCEGYGVDTMLLYLHDPDANIRAQAAHALGEQGTNAKGQVVTRVMAQASRETTGALQHMLLALAHMGEGDPRVEHCLASFLLDRRPHIRERAAFALASLVPERAETARRLAEALGDDSEDVRNAAVCALRAMANSARIVTPALLDELRNKDSFRKWRALRALECIGIEGDLAAERVGEVLMDPSPRLRADAVRVLLTSTTRLPDSALAALKAMTYDPDGEVRVAANKTLWIATAHNSQYVTNLVFELENEKSPVRKGALEALGEMGADAWLALDVLRKLSGKPGPLQEAAKTAFDKIYSAGQRRSCPPG